ncbi:MAG: tRNA (adenosine(37)-N6)-threonylcarbamoyltransferase complex dimerization subunit type 1 TsaB [Phycisphaerales bacterium]|nr:tRNA (adenosine(37)-N6)-threonylcarbamoyltransferase complex dimerization subunit type 1 TsaB [Phycisphaerales bacterium]
MSAVLAIELSQRSGSVALRPGRGAPVVAADVPPSDDRGDHLMDVIDRLCASAGIGARGLRVVAVSVGPGGFTGLRVACATARAIADATGAGAIAVPSALVAARTLVMEHCWAPAEGAEARVLLAAKGADAWGTLVRMESGMPRMLEAALVPAGVDPGVLTIGDAHARALWPNVPADRWLEARVCARACLDVAVALEASGASGDPAGVAPIYPRPPEAVTLWDRRHGASA